VGGYENVIKKKLWPLNDKTWYLLQI